MPLKTIHLKFSLPGIVEIGGKWELDEIEVKATWELSTSNSSPALQSWNSNLRRAYFARRSGRFIPFSAPPGKSSASGGRSFAAPPAA
jgi:hypothetical protein